MRKLSLLFLLFLLNTPAYSSDEGIAQLEARADNINTISPEQEAEILKGINKNIYYKVNNYSPQKLKAIIKYKNQTDKQYARQHNKEYEEPEAVDVNDKIGLKYFFKKDISLNKEPINPYE